MQWAGGPVLERPSRRLAGGYRAPTVHVQGGDMQANARIQFDGTFVSQRCSKLQRVSRPACGLKQRFYVYSSSSGR